MTVVTEALVTRNDRLGDYRVVAFDAPAIAADARPGQFVDIAQPEGCTRLLRRPFSVYLARGDELSIAFDPIGEGTRWIATREPGDRLDVVGPLGHGFDVPGTAEPSLLVGGGYGTAALVLLAERLVARGGEVHSIVGARFASRVFRDVTITRCSTSVTVMTDDGSAGTKGLVVDPIPDLVLRYGIRTVYACGPMPMLEAVARACETVSVPVQVAVEEFMACGIGVCWTCVLPVRTSGVVKHLRSCTDGPVFEGAAVAWA